MNAVRTCYISLALAIGAIAASGDTMRYYRFETDGGVGVSNGLSITTADDSSGNGLNGAPMGSPKYGSTSFANPLPSTGADNQFAFSGGSSNGILLDGSTTPVLSSTFSVEAYFRLSSSDPNTGDVKPIIRVEGGGAGVLSLELLNLNGSGGTNDLLVVMSNDTLEIHAFDLAVDRDYQTAVTYDGTSARLYLDGMLVDSADLSGFAGSGALNGAIGSDVLGTLGFQGQIDELRISDDALSPSQFLDAPPISTPLASPFLMVSVGLAGLAVVQIRKRIAV